MRFLVGELLSEIWNPLTRNILCVNRILRVWVNLAYRSLEVATSCQKSMATCFLFKVN